MGDGDGDEASKERLGCARSIDWQPHPRPRQAICPVSVIVFSSSLIRANDHSEVAKHIVSFHADGD